MAALVAGSLAVTGGFGSSHREAPKRVIAGALLPDDQLCRRGRRLRAAQPRRAAGAGPRPCGGRPGDGADGARERPRPHQLSFGQRRRVAIATVLAMRPRLLVLHEPSANLDPRARRELLEVLEPLDRTLLVVTHDLPFAARLCERAVVLSAGRVVADGPCAEILADEALLAEHDLELPEGFDLALIRTLRPWPMSRCRASPTPWRRARSSSG